MQSLDRSHHTRRQLVSDVISHHDSNSWLPRPSLLDQLHNAAAAAATRALVSAVFWSEIHSRMDTVLDALIAEKNNNTKAGLRKGQQGSSYIAHTCRCGALLRGCMAWYASRPLQNSKW